MLASRFGKKQFLLFIHESRSVSFSRVHFKKAHQSAFLSFAPLQLGLTCLCLWEGEMA